jgi:hypothetical protein
LIFVKIDSLCHANVGLLASKRCAESMVVCNRIEVILGPGKCFVTLFIYKKV